MPGMSDGGSSAAAAADDSNSDDETQVLRPRDWYMDDRNCPPAAVLRESDRLVLCVACLQKGEEIFQNAKNHAATQVNGTLIEDEDNAELQELLTRTRLEEPFLEMRGLYCLVITSDGDRAVGFGQNRETRTRAARLAIAATARMRRGNYMEGFGDSLLDLVQRFHVMCEVAEGRRHAPGPPTSPTQGAGAMAYDLPAGQPFPPAGYPPPDTPRSRIPAPPPWERED